MRRGIAIVLGLGIVATGMWLIATEHSHAAACNAVSGPFSPSGASCQTVGWMYFGGFVVAGLGVMVLLFAALLRRHELPYRRNRDAPTDLTLRMKVRDAALDVSEPPRS